MRTGQMLTPWWHVNRWVTSMYIFVYVFSSSWMTASISNDGYTLYPNLCCCSYAVSSNLTVSPPSTKPTLLTKVSCTGSEEDLGACQYKMAAQCAQPTEVAIECASTLIGSISHLTHSSCKQKFHRLYNTGHSQILSPFTQYTALLISNMWSVNCMLCLI